MSENTFSRKFEKNINSVINFRRVTHFRLCLLETQVWYSTCVCSTVVQHPCVQYSGTAPVCAVQWYSIYVCSTVVQHLCVQCATLFTNVNDKLQCCDTSYRCVNVSCRCASPGAVVQNQLQLGSKTLCHTCMWQIGFQVLTALNPMDPLHNCDV